MNNSTTKYGISPTSTGILNSPHSSLDASDLTDSLSQSVVSAVEAAAFEEHGDFFKLQEVHECGFVYVNKN